MLPIAGDKTSSQRNQRVEGRHHYDGFRGNRRRPTNAEIVVTFNSLMKQSLRHINTTSHGHMRRIGPSLHNVVLLSGNFENRQ